VLFPESDIKLLERPAISMGTYHHAGGIALIPRGNRIRHGRVVNGSRVIYPVPSAVMKAVNINGHKLLNIVFSYLLSQRTTE
jgi:hypothetical protein